MRFTRPFLIAILLTVALPATALADIEVHQGNVLSCKEGIEGELLIAGTSVYFESCPPNGGDAHAKMWTASNAPLAEITVNVEDSTLKVWIGGVELDGSLSALEVSTVEAVFASDEANVAKYLTTETREDWHRRGQPRLCPLTRRGASLL